MERSLLGVKASQNLPQLSSYMAADVLAAPFLTLADACFLTTFLAGVVTAAAGAATAALVAAAGTAAGVGVAANVTAEPNRPAATNRAVRLDFMMDPKSNDHSVGCCYVGLKPTDADCTGPNLV